MGLAISGNIAVDAVVAQGSRPIGPNFEVMETDMNGTVITRLRDISTGSMTEGAPTTLFDMAGFAGMIDQKDVQSAVNYIGLGVSVTPLEEDIDKHQYIVRPITELQKEVTESRKRAAITTPLTDAAAGGAPAAKKAKAAGRPRRIPAWCASAC